jgi:ubiquinone/menaquinone biosynthesis C-methylase UbiE
MVDDSVDAVLASYVLCTVTEPETVLSEILRVLRPGGLFCFAEHVIPDGGLSRRVIRALVPLSIRLQGGCDPSRDMAATIAAAGFVSVDESWTLTRALGLRIPRLCGVARAPGLAANPISRRFSA